MLTPIALDLLKQLEAEIERQRQNGEIYERNRSRAVLWLAALQEILDDQ